MEETWKDIEGFEGLYQVSDLGRVRGLDRYLTVFRNGKHYLKLQKGTLVKAQKNLDGYSRVQLHLGTRPQVKTFLVSRLVAKAFIPNPENKPCVDHISTVRTDDRACNLRWVTHKENSSNPITVEHIKKLDHHFPHYPRRKAVAQYTKNGVLVKVWDSAVTAGSELGIDPSAINCVCNKKPHYHTAGGYKWEYIKPCRQS